jgi:hypothetical protein
VELVGIGPTPSLEMMEVIDFLQNRTLPRMPGMPRNPESPNSLYVYCTANSSKINLIFGSSNAPLLCVQKGEQFPVLFNAKKTGTKNQYVSR